MKPKIVILGAGIGGLTAALALRRRGLDAEVYERAPTLGEVGAGIWMPPNAMQIFERLGVDEAVTSHAVQLERIELANHLGDILQSVSLTEARREHGFTVNSIHRATLQRILAEAWGLARIQFNKECIGVNDEAPTQTLRRSTKPGTPARQPVGRVEFKDGTNVVADVVIGADGLRSRVREYVVPGVVLRDAGQACFRGVANIEMPDELKYVCRETWGVKHRFGWSAIGPAQVYWFAPVSQPCDLVASTARDALVTLYADFPAPVADIITATPPAAILRTDLFDAEPIDRWHNGPCVLLGDAAHPTTPNLGQGAAQAVESAYVLARCLSTHDTPAQAFAAYEKSRMPKAHHVTKTSWMMGKAAHFEGGVARAVRDLALRTTPDAYTEGQVAKLYTLGY